MVQLTLKCAFSFLFLLVTTLEIGFCQTSTESDMENDPRNTAGISGLVEIRLQNKVLNFERIKQLGGGNPRENETAQHSAVFRLSHGVHANQNGAPTRRQRPPMTCHEALPQRLATEGENAAGQHDRYHVPHVCCVSPQSLT